MKQNIFPAVVAGVLMTASAMAQTPPPPATAGAQDKASSGATTLAAGDKAFVKEAAIGAWPRSTSARSRKKRRRTLTSNSSAIVW